MRRLVISEKSSAAARIATILSDGKAIRRSLQGVPVFTFETEEGEVNVVGIRGHIVQLDYPREYSDWERVDPKELIMVEPEKRVTAKKLVQVLTDLARESDEIVIATDYDREGELIGLETVRLLGVEMDKVRRARFSALTKHEIESAFRSLTEPDQRLADSAESRQMIDLAWGASLTRLLSLASGQRGHNFLSVGRVQSPTLGLIVERHREIEEFVPRPYWEVEAAFGEKVGFKGRHRDNPFWEEKAARAVFERCEKEDTAEVMRWELEERNEYPPPPFNTTMLLAEANRLGMSASRAMKVAEDLYTEGYISYPRTDNTVYPRSLSLKMILKKLTDSEFKKEAEELLSQEKIRPSRGRMQTTDHPPIHPVGAATKRKLKGDRWRLYELVARRFMATVAPPARAEITEGELEVAGEIFLSRGYRVIEPGWRRYYPYYKAVEVLLPRLSGGERVPLREVVMLEKKTEPPPRYSQGTLIQEMERLGLGTKSTRHDIIEKLYDRKYVEGPGLVPTESGIAVVEALEKHAKTITESSMTAQLEEDMENIAKGKIELEEVVGESQQMLSGVISVIQENRKEIGEDIRKALMEQRYIGRCPNCGGTLRMIRSRKGTFIGCSNYPNCRTTYPLPRAARVEPTDERCEVCDLPKLRVIRKGQPVSLQCIDPKCESNRERTVLGTCPRCGKTLRIIYSRNGKRFAGCIGYPECGESYPLYQKGTIRPTGEACPSCGAPVVEIRSGRRRWSSCINPECPGEEVSKGKSGKG